MSRGGNRNIVLCHAKRVCAVDVVAFTFASFAPLPPAAMYRPPSAAELNCAEYRKVGCVLCR